MNKKYLKQTYNFVKNKRLFLVTEYKLYDKDLGYNVNLHVLN